MVALSGGALPAATAGGATDPVASAGGLLRGATATAAAGVPVTPGTAPVFRNTKKFVSVVLTAVSPAISLPAFAFMVVVTALSPVVPPNVANVLALAMVVEAPTAVNPAEAKIIKRFTTCQVVFALWKNLALPPHSVAVCTMEACAQASVIAGPLQTPAFKDCQAALLLAANCLLLLGAGGGGIVGCANVSRAELATRDAIRNADSPQGRLFTHCMMFNDHICKNEAIGSHK